MEAFGHLIDGFGTAFGWSSLLYCFIGVLWGTIVGVLPGLGPLAGMSILLPLTFTLAPANAIIMLSGIFYGAMYGGSTTSILVRIPGESASVMTCIDGYEMTRQGRAGPALMIAAIGSWVGGTVSIVGLMLFAPPLAEAMLQIGPPAEFMLIALAILVLTFVSSGPPLKTFVMIVLGLLLATIGLDTITAWPRFTFGALELTEGLSFVAVAIGLFGVSEILLSLERMAEIKAIKPKLRELVPRWRDLREAGPAIGRGTVVGFAFGIVPGVSHVLSTFVSYALEKMLSKTPEQFGKGAIAGVAGPETANNATTGSMMIPLLVLGIPSIPSTAILLSALLIHGIQPGPKMLIQHPDIFWGLIASMYVGNLMLLVLNLPLVGLFVNLLRIPYGYLAPCVLLISVVGVYAVNATLLDLWLMIVFGLAGYLLRKFTFDVAPLLLAFILGGRLELSFRHSLAISNGDVSIFMHGIAAKLFFGLLVLIVLLQAAAWMLGYRRGAVREAD